MPAKNLGKMEQVDLRQVWEDEARDFTPWLASEEGLALLGDTIGRELELVKREASVGPFNADVLARDADEEEHFVVIENQLGKTNHDHLGKLIAYASGLNARTVVWIAESFTDEHRQAIDWLNENMGNVVAFYALQIELWRIGNSPPAPQFRVVSSPNLYESTVREHISEELSETKQVYLRFWEDLREYFQSKKTFLQLRKPRPQHWYDIALGRSHFNLALTVTSRMKRIGCEVYIFGSNAKQAFEMLKAKQNDIEKDLGFKLEWQPLEEKEACRIVLYRTGDIFDVQQRQELKDWFLRTAEQFHKVFSPQIRALQLSKETDESEEG